MNSNNNYNYTNNNSFKEALNTFSNTPLIAMTNTTPQYNEVKPNSTKSIFFWIFIIIALAFLGVNIFNYLAQGTDMVTALLSPIVYIITMLTGDTAKTTLQHTSQGAQTIASESSNILQILLKLITDIFNNSVNFIANTSTSGINYLQSTIKQDKITSTNGTENKNKNENENEKNNEDLGNEEDSVLKNERKLENRVQNVSDSIKNLIVKKENNQPEPSNSESQQHGFCYVGKENNLRRCAKVSTKSKCMSGDIFPTMDICINPKLR
jgi:hypothetical protein